LTDGESLQKHLGFLIEQENQFTAYNTFTPFKAQSETTIPVNSAQDKYTVSLLLGTELHGNSCTMWMHMQQTKDVATPTQPSTI